MNHKIETFLYHAFGSKGGKNSVKLSFSWFEMGSILMEANWGYETFKIHIWIAKRPPVLFVVCRKPNFMVAALI